MDEPTEFSTLSTNGEHSQCVATNRFGERCRQTIQLIGGLCAAHRGADVRERLAEAGRKGGSVPRMKGEPLTPPTEHQPATADDAVLWAGWCAMQVATGRLDSKAADVVNRSLAQLLNALDKADLQARLDKVEKLVKGNGR
jgi:hypothetical protein